MSELPHLNAIRRGAHLGLAACLGTPIAPTRLAPSPDLALAIGFSGGLTGQLQLVLPWEVARRLAAGLEPVALLEAATLVGGAVANELAREGVMVRLGEPTLWVGAACAFEELLAVPGGCVGLGVTVAGTAWAGEWLTAVVPGYNPHP